MVSTIGCKARWKEFDILKRHSNIENIPFVIVSCLKKKFVRNIFDGQDIFNGHKDEGTEEYSDANLRRPNFWKIQDPSSKTR